jgi:hypothetical protein
MILIWNDQWNSLISVSNFIITTENLTNIKFFPVDFTGN